MNVSRDTNSAGIRRCGVYELWMRWLCSEARRTTHCVQAIHQQAPERHKLRHLSWRGHLDKALVLHRGQQAWRQRRHASDRCWWCNTHVGVAECLQVGGRQFRRYSTRSLNALLASGQEVSDGLLEAVPCALRRHKPVVLGPAWRHVAARYHGLCQGRAAVTSTATSSTITRVAGCRLPRELPTLLLLPPLLPATTTARLASAAAA
mmetsp:Transcript_137843/g.344090  ORF Transcript_137843/g.344090 Transcript_137843/m.344090 type:complete len:206 (-) Transcript_137843:547-1164(-)